MAAIRFRHSSYFHERDEERSGQRERAMKAPKTKAAEVSSFLSQAG